MADITARLTCPDFPCGDVVHGRFTLPGFDVEPAAIRMLMVLEAPPTDPADWFTAPGEPFFWETTRQAFADAGAEVAAVEDLAGLGVYLTTAIKCAKAGYGVRAATITACAERILERELDALPQLRAVLLGGDVAIKALNSIARRRTGKRVIPAGSTYKIRGGEYRWEGIRVFPSYLTTGASFLIEASKREMAAEDIRIALELAMG
jgi:uracil-DNA glycosylase